MKTTTTAYVAVGRSNGDSFEFKGLSAPASPFMSFDYCDYQADLLMFSAAGFDVLAKGEEKERPKWTTIS